jgi:hypothetical protein
MLLILSGLVGLAFGLTTGGRVGRLADIRFRLPIIVLAAYGIKEVGVLYEPLARSPISPWLYVVALATLIAWTLWHRDVVPGIQIVALGMAMNLAAVLANAGHMPVARALADRGPAALLKYGVLGQYILAGNGTRLDFLGDWIALPGTLGKMLSQAYSPGDLVAAVGMVVTVFLAVRPARGAITSR